MMAEPQIQNNNTYAANWKHTDLSYNRTLHRAVQNRTEGKVNQIQEMQ